MAGILDDQAADYFYQDDLYLERPDEKFSCPICLCPVQREAYLTECCGRHFCRSCIARLKAEPKPCPMCKAVPLAIFPNKERQREIKQIHVRCPLSLAQYRDVGGRGQSTCTSTEDGALSDEIDSKVTEERCVENKGGFSNKTDASEVTILSTIVDELKLKDDSSTKNRTLSKVDIHEKQVTEVVRPESVDHAENGDTITCDWTGELGQVENHVLEVHGAEALSRIKNDDDLQSPAAQGHDHQHHHPPNPRNVTFHYVRTPHGGVNFHYHVHHSAPFNVSNTAPSIASNILSSSYSGNHSFVNQGSVSSSGDNQAVIGGNGLNQSQVGCSTPPSPQQANLEPNIGLQPHIHAQVPHQAPIASQSSLPASEPQTVLGQPHQQQLHGDLIQSRPVVVGQPPSPAAGQGQYVVFQLGQGQPMFVRPRRCPHHMRGMHGGHHHHYGGHRHHFHHHPPGPPPPPPPHGPSHPHHPGPPHPHHAYGPPPPPGRGFPRGPGRGGHPHHHHHHPHGGRHRCHGHHHPPPH